MEEKLNQLVESYREEMVATTSRLIAYPSVYEEPVSEAAPYGRAINEALEAVLEIAAGMGFETKNYQGHVGTVDWGSEGKQIGILSHIDVVPVGDGWTFPPFEGTVHQGKLYGRGAVDDKGPMVAALYAMKAVRDSGLPVKNHVRHIIGADEESGMRCLNYYLQKEKQPWGGFSPDAEFPVIHAEKGILRFELKDCWKDEDNKPGIRIIAIKGGLKLNTVPPQAVAYLVADSEGKELIEHLLTEMNLEEEISLHEEDKKIILTAQGQSAHSSTPWNGKNAINTLINFLAALPLAAGGQAGFVQKMRHLFADGYRGEALGVCCEDKLSGILTLSLGLIEVGAEKGSASVEIRYPIHASREVILKTLNVACQEEGLALNILQDKAHLYLPVKDPLVQTLHSVYCAVTGRSEEPVVIGGGTYCRAMENFAAYGPLFPGQRELAHEADEYIGVDDLVLAGKIYAQALYTLLNH